MENTGDNQGVKEALNMEHIGDTEALWTLDTWIRCGQLTFTRQKWFLRLDQTMELSKYGTSNVVWAETCESKNKLMDRMGIVES